MHHLIFADIYDLLKRIMIHLSIYHHCLQVLTKTLTFDLHNNPEEAIL